MLYPWNTAVLGFMTPTFLSLFFLSRSFLPDFSFSTYWNALECPRSLFIDCLSVSLCVCSMVIASILGSWIWPLWGQRPPNLCPYPNSSWGPAMYVSTLTWMSCRPLKFNVAKLTRLFTIFPHTSTLNLLLSHGAPFQNITVSLYVTCHQILSILCQRLLNTFFFLCLHWRTLSVWTTMASSEND